MVAEALKIRSHETWRLRPWDPLVKAEWWIVSTLDEAKPTWLIYREISSKFIMVSYFVGNPPIEWISKNLLGQFNSPTTLRATPPHHSPRRSQGDCTARQGRADLVALRAEAEVICQVDDALLT